MGRGTPKKRTRTAAPAAARSPLVVRTTADQDAQLEAVRRRHQLATQQQTATLVLNAGLRAVALEDAVRLHRQGYSLEEAARQVQLPVAILFEHFIRERIPLMENRDALEHLARLAGQYHVPSLERAVEEIRRDLRQPQPA